MERIRKAARCVHQVVCLVMSASEQTPEGRPPTANTHALTGTVDIANINQSTALAVCRVTLAGTAETGAGGRQPSFDPIRFNAKACWATRKRDAWQHA